MAAPQTFNFETGTPGATILIGDTPSAGDTAWDVTSIGTGASATYDTTHAAHGGQALKISTTSGTSANCFVSWTTSIGTQTKVWFRAYAYFTANPAGTTRLFQTINGSTQATILAVTTAGKLQQQFSASSTATTTSTATIPLNQWFRVEGFHLAGTATGQMEAKLFSSMDSATATETNTSVSTLATGFANFTGYRFGQGTTSSLGLGPFWLDDAGLSITTYMGAAQLTASDTDVSTPAQESYTLMAALPDVDAGTGSDVETPAAAVLADTDTGSGLDAGSASASGTAVSSADTGHFTDAGEKTALISPDTGSGLDAGEKTKVASADAGALSVDGQSLTATLADADTGHSADAQALTAAVPSADTGTGTDGGEHLAATALTDSGSAADTSTKTALTDTDTALGTELARLALSDSDTGHLGDGQAVAVPVVSADTGTGTEGSALSARPQDADHAAAADASAISATLHDADSAAAAETQLVVLEVSRTPFVFVTLGVFAPAVDISVDSPEVEIAILDPYGDAVS